MAVTTNGGIYYTPDNTCKFESYGAADSDTLIINVKIENHNKLISHHVNEVFNSIPTAQCPFDEEEISDIIYEWEGSYTSSLNSDVYGDRNDVIYINSEGYIEIDQSYATNSYLWYNTLDTFDLKLLPTNKYRYSSYKNIQLKPDYACWESTYETTDLETLIIKAAVQLDGKLYFGHVTDLFRNVQGTECPLEEI